MRNEMDTYEWWNVNQQEITALDLREELERGKKLGFYLCAKFQWTDNDGYFTPENRGQLIYAGKFERVGVVLNGDAIWTDCTGSTDSERIEDAIERVLGIDGKEISN